MAFSPSNLSSLAIWFDAYDPSFLTITNSNTVQRWRDRSAASNVLSNSSFPTYNLYGLNKYPNVEITKTASLSNYLFTSALTNPANTSNLSFFCLYTANPLSDGNARIVSFGRIEDGTTNFDFSTVPNFILATSGTNLAVWRNGSQISITGLGSNVPIIASGVFTGTGVSAFVNGSLIGSFSTSGTFTFNRMALGRNINTTGDALNGTISEVIIYYSTLTTDQRQQVEGYLGWKWGIQSNLPASNLYKTFPPGAGLQSSIYTLDNARSILAVNSYSTIKTIQLTPISTNIGRLLYIKDSFGYSSTNNILLRTTGTDSIESTSISTIRLSTNYGAWALTNDMNSRWFFTNIYKNTVSLTSANPFPTSLAVDSNYYPGLWTSFYSNVASPPFKINGPGWGSTIISSLAFSSISVGNSFYSSQTEYLSPVENYFIMQAAGYMYSATSNRVQFETVSDDGIFVSLNNSTILDNWSIRPISTIRTPFALIAPGYSPFTLNYFQNAEGAICKFAYQFSSPTGFLSSLSSVFFYNNPSQSSKFYFTGLWVKFYNMTSAPPGTTVGSTGWGAQIGTASNIPSTIALVDASLPQLDNVVLTIRGYYFSSNADTFQIQTLSDDGVLVLLNGVSILSNWTIHGGTTDTSIVASVDAGYTPIEIRFFENAGGATLNVSWQSGNSPGYKSDFSGRFFYDYNSTL